MLYRKEKSKIFKKYDIKSEEVLVRGMEMLSSCSNKHQLPNTFKLELDFITIKHVCAITHIEKIYI